MLSLKFCALSEAKGMVIKMTESLKHYLYVVFSKLSFDERREIMAYLKDMNLNSDTGFKDTIDEIRKKRYSSGFFCPVVKAKKW